VGPDELLGDDVLGDFAEIAEEGSVFEGHVDAVAVADVSLAEEALLVNAERELGRTTALLEA
jgi:hypothetical protein